MAASWNEFFPIGDGSPTTEEDAPPVYRSYEECGIGMTQQLFNELSQLYKIYVATTALKDITFTPRDVMQQHTSDYYFTHFQVKFPRYH